MLLVPICPRCRGVVVNQCDGIHDCCLGCGKTGIVCCKDNRDFCAKGGCLYVVECIRPNGIHTNIATELGPLSYRAAVNALKRCKIDGFVSRMRRVNA